MGFRSKSTRRASKIKLADGLNEFFVGGPRQGRRLSAASRLTWKSQNAASPLRGEAESGRAQSEGSLWRRSDAKWGERSITRRVRRNRQPNGDSENPTSISFRSGGQHRGREECCPLTQAPAETAAVTACVASRTKRATVRAEVKMSAKMDALALLERPNQGERFTPRRAWSALRLSA
jgi:hypothetical protein